MPMPQLSRWILLAFIALFAGRFVGQTITNVPPPPAQLTAEQDHQRILDLLHITSLRRGPDGDPKSPHALILTSRRLRLLQTCQIPCC
jgi:hypothetical protein